MMDLGLFNFSFLLFPFSHFSFILFSSFFSSFFIMDLDKEDKHDITCHSHKCHIRV